MSKARIFQVRSMTDSNKSYTVRFADEGKWFCSCPVNVFRNIDCKHIIEVKSLVDNKKEIPKCLKIPTKK